MLRIWPKLGVCIEQPSVNWSFAFALIFLMKLSGVEGRICSDLTRCVPVLSSYTTPEKLALVRNYL